MDWLKQNDFAVANPHAYVPEIRYQVFGDHLLLHPTPGNLVAVHGKMQGFIVFEMAFHASGQDCAVRVEGYIPGVGLLPRGKEWPFSTTVLGVLGLPRKRGHEALAKLQSALTAMSAASPPLSFPPLSPAIQPRPLPSGESPSPVTSASALPQKPPVSKSARVLILLSLLVLITGIIVNFMVPFPFGLLFTAAGLVLLLTGMRLQRKEAAAWKKLQSAIPTPAVSPASAQAQTNAPKFTLPPEEVRTFKMIAIVGGVLAAAVPAALFWYFGWFKGRLFFPALLIIFGSVNVVLHGARLYYQMKLRKEKAAATSGSPPGPST